MGGHMIAILTLTAQPGTAPTMTSALGRGAPAVYHVCRITVSQHALWLNMCPDVHEVLHNLSAASASVSLARRRYGLLITWCLAVANSRHNVKKHSGQLLGG
jgi:hypothetical protein